MRRVNRVFLNSKRFWKTLAGGVVFGLAALSCAEGPLPETRAVVFPALPAAWEEILGPPHWRLEWIGADGNLTFREGLTGGRAGGISPPPEWTSPVVAWPYWPERKLAPKEMRPAGALFPWDVSGGGIILSWEAGVDAVFWRELAAAASRATDAATDARPKERFPWRFDWPRFRELIKSQDISAEVRRDPWTADWKTIAEKTFESGFDRRRLKPEKTTEITVPLPPGLWAARSPFVPPATILPGENLAVKSGEKTGTWVSAFGLLRFQGEIWALFPAHLP